MDLVNYEAPDALLEVIMYQVIIVEDDPMVSSINRQYLQANPALQIAGAFRNGQDALKHLKKHPADLAIVDYYMPVMDGLTFIRSCHEQQIHLDFIMITAANNARELSEVMRQGVIDYLVKPFTYERFWQAVDKFLKIRKALENDGKLSQEDIDRLFRADLRRNPAQNPLEKGLQPKTLEMIREFLAGHSEEFLSSEEIARQVHLSRITVRRYVNYMLETQEIISQIDYTTGGRPSIRYRKKNV